MNVIVNFVMRLLGMGKAVEALNGAPSKAYAAGVGKILGGAAGLLGGLAAIAVSASADMSAPALVGLVQGLLHGDARLAAVTLGYYAIMDGLSDIGLRHAAAKAAAPAQS